MALAQAGIVLGKSVTPRRFPPRAGGLQTHAQAGLRVWPERRVYPWNLSQAPQDRLLSTCHSVERLILIPTEPFAPRVLSSQDEKDTEKRLHSCRKETCKPGRRRERKKMKAAASSTV